MELSDILTDQLKQEVIGFAQELVRIKSYSGQEEEIIKHVAERMNHLDYDEVLIDSMGNLLGRIGDGSESVLFDSHVDTVTADDGSEWDIEPFSGEIRGGKLHGRGSVDMKSAVAASVYAAALVKRAGLVSDKTVYVSCTVYEEDCDGENLRHLFNEFNLKPDYVVICEPSNNRIMLGHKGRAQFSIKTYGIAAHGSAPEKGINAIYEMSEIIKRVEDLNARLSGAPTSGSTVVMSSITSKSASLNAVPSECEVFLDRRIVPGETEEDLGSEMDNLVQGKNATWEVSTITRTSWRGMEIIYRPFHLAWKINSGEELVKNCVSAYRTTFGRDPGAFGFWDFSTNAVTPVSMGIPVIGFGPGDYKLAHMRNESCSVVSITDACSFYISLMCQ